MPHLFVDVYLGAILVLLLPLRTVFRPRGNSRACPQRESFDEPDVSEVDTSDWMGIRRRIGICGAPGLESRRTGGRSESGDL